MVQSSEIHSSRFEPSLDRNTRIFSCLNAREEKENTKPFFNEKVYRYDQKDNAQARYKPHLCHELIDMTIDKGIVVELEYQLYLDDPNGELIEETMDGEPFTFLFGYEEVLDKLQNTLKGLTAGDTFSVSIPCDEAYGKPEESAVAELPKELFKVKGRIDESALEVGELVPMSDDEGNEIEGFVLANNPDSVVLDFNHPLSGENLHFDGRVLNLREATSAELSSGEASVSL